MVSGDLPEKLTLRYWPWLAMSMVGTVAFGALALLFGLSAANTDSMVTVAITGTVTIVLCGLVIYTLASLRTRTVADRSGVTARTAFTRTRVDWSQVARLDVSHSMPGWAVRAWTEHGKAVIFLCHDTHGRRPQTRSYDEPPPEAPIALRDGFEILQRYQRRSTLQPPRQERPPR